MQRNEEYKPLYVEIDLPDDMSAVAVIFMSAITLVFAFLSFRSAYTNTFAELEYGLVINDDTGLLRGFHYVMSILLTLCAIAIPFLVVYSRKKSDVLKRIVLDADGITVNGIKTAYDLSKPMTVVYDRSRCKMLADLIYLRVGGLQYKLGRLDSNETILALDKIKNAVDMYCPGALVEMEKNV